MPTDSEINKSMYLIGLRNLEKLEIQFVPPTLNTSRTANIAELVVVGRSNPLHHYTSGSSQLTFKLDFYAKEKSREDVIRKCRWLESLQVHGDDNEGIEPVKLVFGKLFKDEVWIVKSANAELSNFDPAYGMMPKQAYIELVLTRDVAKSLKRKDIRGN